MAQNDAKSANAVTITPVAENESAPSLFINGYLTIKNYRHKEYKDSLLLSNENGDIQSISTEQFLHLAIQIGAKKKFVQTIQDAIKKDYNGKPTDKPDIKIQGNRYSEKGKILLEVLHSKDGSIKISRPSDVAQRMYFRIDETIFLAYHMIFENEITAKKHLEKLALARTVNDAECLTL
jgi:hypothetical protein